MFEREKKDDNNGKEKKGKNVWKKYKYFGRKAKVARKENCVKIV